MAAGSDAPRFLSAGHAAAWLKDRPIAVTMAMAARAALRAGPLLAEPSRAPRDAAWREGVVLPWFRAVALSQRGAELLALDEAAWEATTISEAAVAAAAAAQHAADAAHAAAERAVGVSSSTQRADGAGRAARAAACAAYCLRRAAYRDQSARGRAAGAASRNLSEHDVAASEADAAQVERGDDAARLLSRPLWPDCAAPAAWPGVRVRLTSADRRWAVWTDWWEARARGGDPPAMRDLARIVAETRLPWDRGADAVNDLLARLAVEQGLPWLVEPERPPDAPRDEAAGGEAAEHAYPAGFGPEADAPAPPQPPPQSHPQFPNRISEAEPDPALRDTLAGLDTAARQTLAARAALRALPAMLRPLEWDAEARRASLALPSFRAAATAWTAARSGPGARLAEPRRAAAAGAANIDSAAARAAERACAADAWAALAHAVDAASGVAAMLTPDTPPGAKVMHSSQAAARGAQADVEDAMRADAALLVRDGRPQSLAAAPLWPGGAPRWAVEAWSRLSDALLDSGEGWEVWTGWYEARLGGEAGDPLAERARVALPEPVWSLPPAEANAVIARAVAPDAPAQISDAKALLAAARGVIRLLPLLRRSLAESQRERHPAIRATLALPAFRTAAAAWAMAHGGPAQPLRSAMDWSARKLPTAPTNSRTGQAAAWLARTVATPRGFASAAGYARGESSAPGEAYEFARADLREAFLHDLGFGPEPAPAPGPPPMRQLWPGEPPRWWDENAAALNSILQDAGEDWAVWLDWLGDRLNGRPADIAFETSLLTLDDALWDAGPAAVNAEIARMIADREGAGAEDEPSAPEPPAERPAPVHFEMRDGALRPAPPLAEAARPGFVAAARAGLVAAADDLLAAGAGRQNPRLATVLGRLREALGPDPDALDAMSLGVCAGRLSAQAARADETLMPQDAAELVALDIELQRFLAHLPEWRAYLEDVSRGFDAPEVEQAAVADAAAAMEAIARAAPDLIAEDAAESLAELRDAATPDPSPDDPTPLAPALARRSYLRAARSALRALAAHALGPVARGAGKGVEKAAEGAAFAAAGVGVVAGLSALAARLPSEFGWLAAVVGHIARLVGLA
ncbi:hypothetical protein [Rubrimonas cliftonensis]|uniref:Uncharacterized protein n=1 Tax=Rubrimonas cliftonensis TaxID=89524 RepID=A0A1H4EUP8_9RHOB|nr:hypothetical protein [Rubrimonas cliftonensis]SEA88723.1 hypothetical protein SAMN05444370_1168 [Rubrimonas cliftonensis]